MDKLEDRLKRDAALIRADVTVELDERIRASLEAVQPVPGECSSTGGARFRWWWVSSLTGIAAAVLIIVLVNPGWHTPEPRPVANSMTVPAVIDPPAIAPLLQAETAVLTAPLQQELENLESDVKKASRLARDEIGLSF